jgi:hypothetical protein
VNFASASPTRRRRRRSDAGISRCLQNQLPAGTAGADRGFDAPECEPLVTL